MVMMTRCPDCGTRVCPKSNGTCPACGSPAFLESSSCTSRRPATRPPRPPEQASRSRAPLSLVQPSAGVVFYFLVGIAGIILVGAGGMSLARTDSFRDLFTPGPRPASVETVPESLAEILMLLCGAGCLALASWIWHRQTMPQQLATVALRSLPARVVYAIILLVSRSLFVLAGGLFLALWATNTVGRSSLLIVGIATLVLVGAIAVASVRIAFFPAASLQPIEEKDAQPQPAANTRHERQSECQATPETGLSLAAAEFEHALVAYLRRECGVRPTRQRRAGGPFWEFESNGHEACFTVSAKHETSSGPAAKGPWSLRLEEAPPFQFVDAIDRLFRPGSRSASHRCTPQNVSRFEWQSEHLLEHPDPAGSGRCDAETAATSPADTDVTADDFETNLIDYLRADHGLFPSPVSGGYHDYWQVSLQGSKLDFAVLAKGKRNVVPTGVRWILRIEGELAPDLGKLLAESFRAGSMHCLQRPRRVQVQYKSIDLLAASRLATRILSDTQSAPIHAAELIAILAKSQDTDERRRAAALWRGIGPETADQVPDLLAILREGDENSGRLAVEALGRIGKPARAAVDVLTSMWRNNELREQVSFALQRIAPGLLRSLI